MNDICFLTLSELMAAMDKGDVTSAEAVEAYLGRISKVDPELNSYVTVDADGARKAAIEADQRRANGEKAPLLGAPLAIKDLMATSGLRTACGSKILENFVPPYDSFAVAKLKEAGAVILGKTNMDEFAMGSSNETSYFGPVKNPWNMEKIPGGSSGGSAAAVAADLCAAALGSDTGGSIRQPASLCGIVGLKPTYGRVSRFGLVAFASSLDQIGPMTKDIRDAALLTGIISGHDPMDSTCAEEPVGDYLSGLDKGVEGMTVGVPDEYFIEGMDPEVESKVRAAIEILGSKGAIIKRISLPHTKYAVPTYYVIAPAEASSNLARYDGVRYGYRDMDADGLFPMYLSTRNKGFGSEVKRRIMLGTYALSAGYYDAYYLKAQKARTLIKRDFQKAFENVSVIVAPTAPAPAFGLGEKINDPLKMYLSDIFTISANLAGIPGVSVPCGLTKKGEPIGLQILGSYFQEASTLRAARTLEKEIGFSDEKPRIGIQTG
ncbi:MAG: Asp-tRNA(Asn)/Glu-tRNA(Gln) amidotransferase subunit GatA [Nitrospinota bacterium]|nr:Asp-tRNA(Asn)/Glu-tRNA(Gln) amidotransferase subunit GatA [Nitrospinota bacterium]